MFYKIEEGDFGEDNCVLFADSQYLQDIGTQAYTEYEFGPDYFQFLMENPSYMDMKQGHLHSHNTMGVFFSGTDNSELVTNSEFHNYYLSLIVNNRNEMTARVAFRVTKRSKVNSTIDSVIEYRDSSGQLKTTEPTSEVQEKDNVETTVYYFECEIIKPEMPSDPLAERVNVIIEKKNAATLAAAKNKPNALKGFKEYSGDGWDDWEKEKEKNRNWAKDKFNSKTVEQRDLFDLDDTTGKKGGKPKHQDRPGLNRKAVKRIQGEADRKANAFIAALLSGDPLSRAGVGEILDILDDRLDSKHAVSKFVDLIESDLMNAYMAIYPEDFNMDNCGHAVTRACAILEEYRETYEYLVDPIIISLQTQTSAWK